MSDKNGLPIPVLTENGLEQANQAKKSGIKIEFLEIGLGTELYVPSGKEIGLKKEKERFKITEIRDLKGAKIEISVEAFSNHESYQVGEIGLFTKDGLFALMSREKEPIEHKTPESHLLFGFVVFLSQLPKDIFKISLAERPYLDVSDAVAKLAIELIASNRKLLQIENRLINLEEKI